MRFLCWLLQGGFMWWIHDMGLVSPPLKVVLKYFLEVNFFISQRLSTGSLNTLESFLSPQVFPRSKIPVYYSFWENAGMTKQSSDHQVLSRSTKKFVCEPVGHRFLCKIARQHVEGSVKGPQNFPYFFALLGVGTLDKVWMPWKFMLSEVYFWERNWGYPEVMGLETGCYLIHGSINYFFTCPRLPAADWGFDFSWDTMFWLVAPPRVCPMSTFIWLDCDQQCSAAQSTLIITYHNTAQSSIHLAVDDTWAMLPCPRWSSRKVSLKTDIMYCTLQPLDHVYIWKLVPTLVS
jgi:hypothetical protein